MVIKLLIPIIAIILDIWNLISPMQCDGPIVLRFAKRNPEIWNVSQRTYAVQSLVLNLAFCILMICSGSNDFSNNSFIVFLIVIGIQLLPILFTYVILRIKYKKLK